MSTPAFVPRVGDRAEITLRRNPEVPARVGTVRVVRSDQAYVSNVDDPGADDVFGQWVNHVAWDDSRGDQPFLVRRVG